MTKKKSWHEAAIPGGCDDCPVRGLALFKPLEPREITAAQAYRSTHRQLAPGCTIYRQGEPFKEVYTLYDGWAYLYQHLPDGGRQILTFLLPGDFFGFQADMGDGERIHSAQAITGVTLCVFPRPDLMRMFREHVDLGIRLIWMSAQDEAIAYEHLASLGRRTAKECIAHLLLEIFHRVRARQPDPEALDTIDFPLTQGLIADACGLTHIHVSRTLKSLQDESLVRCKGGKLHIPDPERLARFANYSQGVFIKRAII